MTGKGLVSVVVPLYNKEATLARTIDSVRSQTYENWELLIVDDGSHDRGPELAREFAARDSRIQLLEQTNAGPGAARNTGLAKGRGEFVSFLDADDEHDSRFLARAIEALSSRPNAALFAASHFRSVNGRRHDFTPYFANFGVSSGTHRIGPDTPAVVLLGYLWFHHSGAIVARRERIQTLGGYYDKNRSLFGEDTYLWLQVLLNHEVCCSLEPLMWYHTEDSALCGGGSGKEVPAMLLAPNDVRARCPQHLTSLLEDFFGLFALLHVWTALIPNGDLTIARQLLSSFPRACKFEYHDRALHALGLGGTEAIADNGEARLAWFSYTAGPPEGGPWSTDSGGFLTRVMTRWQRLVGKNA